MHALALDLELNKGTPIEIGLTEINLLTNTIVKTMSLPIKCKDSLDEEIVKLTGWTDTKLNRCGKYLWEWVPTLLRNGSKNRLIIVDSSDELLFIENYVRLNHIMLSSPFGNEVINVSHLYSLISGDYESRSLDNKLEFFGLRFEGRPHRASTDSLNIARLFLKIKEDYLFVKKDEGVLPGE